MPFYVFIVLKSIYEFLIKDQVRKLINFIKTRVAQMIFRFFLNPTPTVMFSEKDSSSLYVTVSDREYVKF